jgi:hypothetical protein
MENKGLKYKTAQHRIYEYKLGLIPLETLLSYGYADKTKGKSNPTTEFRRLQGSKTRPLRCPPAGSWEREHIRDDGRVGVTRTGRPQGSQDTREQPAYSPGQFRIAL